MEFVNSTIGLARCARGGLAVRPLHRYGVYARVVASLVELSAMCAAPSAQIHVRDVGSASREHNEV